MGEIAWMRERRKDIRNPREDKEYLRNIAQQGYFRRAHSLTLKLNIDCWIWMNKYRFLGGMLNFFKLIAKVQVLV